MELDARTLAYVAYRASRSALVHQLNEIRLTIEALSEVIKRLNITPGERAEVDEFFKKAQREFAVLLKESFAKAKAEAKAEIDLKDKEDKHDVS